MSVPDDNVRIAFRPLTSADLPLLHDWLNHGDVLRWYGQRPSSLAEVSDKYAPRIRGESPTRPFVILYNERPVGYIQAYLVSAYPEHSGHTVLEEGQDAGAIDVFIGEDAYRHRGFGAPMLRQFLHEVIFGRMGVSICVIDPEPDNTTAIRAYEKAGFRHVRTVENLETGEQAYVMVIHRGDVPGVAIYHITSSGSWNRAVARGSYEDDTLEKHGFIHCSTARQVIGVANALYRGQADLVLLHIDAGRVTSEIRYERLPGGELFPHIYGSLNLDAVTRVVALRPNAEGAFDLPESLA